MQIFRGDLLEGRTVAVSGPAPPSVAELLGSLGADVLQRDARPLDAREQDARPLDVLQRDARPLDAREQDARPLDVLQRDARPLDALVRVHPSGDELLIDTWSAVHAVATEVFIPAKAGRILLVVPHERGNVARAGLGNLARTLSVEWARFGITTVAIAPGPATSDDDLAALVAFLCSEAGAYYSGCRFDLR